MLDEGDDGVELGVDGQPGRERGGEAGAQQLGAERLGERLVGKCEQRLLAVGQLHEVDEDRAVGQHAAGDVERQHAVVVAVEQLGGDGVADVVGDDHRPVRRLEAASTRSVRSAWVNNE